MKKLILISLAIAISGCMLAFKNISETSTQVTITVTSDKVTTFDMLQLLNSKDRIVRTFLKTPYKLTLNVVEGKFIFRTLDKDSKVLIKFEKQNMELKADWPVTVVTILNDSMMTFGMD